MTHWAKLKQFISSTFGKEVEKITPAELLESIKKNERKTQNKKGK